MHSTVSLTQGVSPENIPAELKSLPQWVVHKKKIPHDAKTTGDKAKVNDSNTWASFEQALSACRNGCYHGIGFVFTENDPFCGIDLDKCRDPKTGEVEQWALKTIRDLDSYTEISLSGTGLHVIAKGVLPPGRHRKDKIELYNRLRYFTITGHIFEGYAAIKDRQPEIKALCKQVFPDGADAPIQVEQKRDRIPDTVLINHAIRAKNGDLFTNLWLGDWTGYSSQSEADLALLNLLAFWTSKDADQMDGLFRQSGLYREKWERDDYRNTSISRAIASCKEVFRTDAAAAFADDEPKDRKGTSKKKQSAPRILCMADIEAQEVAWLWKPYIPKGKLTLLEGDPGQGKTWLALQLAAIVSNGWPWPGTDGNPSGDGIPENVLYLTAEDGPADTLRPRLDAAGADPARVFLLTGKVDENEEDGPRTSSVFLSDTGVLRSAFTTVRPALVVVDPLQAYLGMGVDMHRANEVRPLLSDLANLAEEFNTAVLCIRHLGKGTQDRVIYRGLGSIDFTAAARSILLAGTDPKNQQKRAIIHIKSSCAVSGPAIGYELGPFGFQWTGLSDLDALDILRPERAESKEESKLDKAMGYLQEQLQDGRKGSQELIDEAESAHNIHRRTLFEAKKRIGVRAIKSGTKWYWYLQDEMSGEDSGEDLLL